MKFNVEKLVYDLSSPRIETRRVAIQKLVWVDNPNIIDSLIHALDDEDIRVRFLAALALQKHPTERTKKKLIDHMINDRDGDVRAMCIGALSKASDDEIIDLLISTLDDPHPHVKMNAIRAFEYRNDGRALAQINKLLDDGNWHVARTAVEVLIKLKSITPHILETINRLRACPEAAVEKEMNEAMGKLLESVVETPEIIGPVIECRCKVISEEEEIGFRESMDAAREKIIEEECSFSLPPSYTLDDLEHLAKELLDKQE